MIDKQKKLDQNKLRYEKFVDYWNIQYLNFKRMLNNFKLCCVAGNNSENVFLPTTTTDSHTTDHKLSEKQWKFKTNSLFAKFLFSLVHRWSLSVGVSQRSKSTSRSREGGGGG